MNYLVSLVGCFVFMANVLMNQCSGSQTLKTQDFDNVVRFDYSEIEHKHIFKSGKPVTLNDSEISDTIDVLKKAVIENNSKAKKERSVASADNYNLQFVSVVNDQKQKIIWINALCRNSNSYDDKWKKSIIRVKDGGSCYFNLYINLTEKSYENFIVNGES
jgi:hypothetical protein